VVYNTFHVGTIDPMNQWCPYGDHASAQTFTTCDNLSVFNGRVIMCLCV